jgi:hypothetical protein
MFHPGQVFPGPTSHRVRRTAAIVMLLIGALQTGPAQAAVAKTVRWAASPLWTTLGQPLPPATSYEVWLTRTGYPEALVAAVTDTFYTLQAELGTTYILRVRGVSATGLKSAFSEYSDPFKILSASAVLPELMASCGPAMPNPFNPRTSIAYLVPENLPAAAPLDMQIFDVRGRRILDFELDRSPGTHQVTWNGNDESGRSVPAGLYVARYVCGSYRASVKLTLVS